MPKKADKPKKSNKAVTLYSLDKYEGQEINRRSAIRLKCLDCTGNQKPEIRLCRARDCPLWPYRGGGKWEDPKLSELDIDWDIEWEI